MQLARQQNQLDSNWILVNNKIEAISIRKCSRLEFWHSVRQIKISRKHRYLDRRN